MTICELSELLDAPICIHYRTLPPLVGTERWYAEIMGAEVKDDTILISAIGNGNTPAQALDNYVLQIRGKLIVLDAYNKEKRRVFQVPQSLTTGVN
jgi:hypothetical protein